MWRKGKILNCNSYWMVPFCIHLSACDIAYSWLVLVLYISAFCMFLSSQRLTIIHFQFGCYLFLVFLDRSLLSLPYQVNFYLFIFYFYFYRNQQSVLLLWFVIGISMQISRGCRGGYQKIWKMLQKASTSTRGIIYGWSNEVMELL